VSDLDRLNESCRLRILVVGDVFPWPARDGYRLRFSSVLNALSEVGDIDLFVAAWEGEDDVDQPPDIISRYEVVVAPMMDPSLARYVRTGSSQLPTRILWRVWTKPHDVLRHFVKKPYDLVWYCHADTFVAIGDPSFGPAVVDLDNLESHVLRRVQSRSLTASTRKEGLLRLPHVGIGALTSWSLYQRDRLMWSRLQRAISTTASSTVVCSEIDQKRLATNRVTIVPNSYEDPGPPSDSLSMAPILLMVALFTYQPNLDGARWLAHEVLPGLRRLVPDVTIRLVGRNDERLRAIAAVPGVEIVGEVDRIDSELRDSRGVVVPILSGGGTRVKVLEALAYGVPIVSTTIGCEGIGITTDHHAMVRNDPLEFAVACAQILSSNELCESLRTNGRTLYQDRYRTEIVAAQIRRLALSVARD
jgi:glycosyltransferase involved in cell wall biosynthesis